VTAPWIGGDDGLTPYLRGWADGASRWPLPDDEDDPGRSYGLAELVAVFDLGRTLGRRAGQVDRDVVETAERLAAHLIEAGVSTPSDPPPAPHKPRPRHWPARAGRRRTARAGQ
jgi:hypothetical protein